MTIAVVYIEWQDSSTSHGWDAYESLEEGLPSTVSVGLLIEEREDHYAIAHSYDPDTGEYNGLIRIPRAAVVKARTLCRVQVKAKPSG